MKDPCGNEIELRLRSGEWIGCDPDQVFPTTKGLVRGRDLRRGDMLHFELLPEPQCPSDSVEMGLDAGRLSGLYLAEGDLDENTIEISGHASERESRRWVLDYAKRLGRAAQFEPNSRGKRLYLNVYGAIVLAFMQHFIYGQRAQNKCFTSACCGYGNEFLKALLDEYLAAMRTGTPKKVAGAWVSVGIMRLPGDLRALAARLGWRLVLNRSHATCEGKRFKTFKGELRYSVSGHRTCKSPSEIVGIRRSRCRDVYQIKAENAHQLVLASGVAVILCPSPDWQQSYS